MDEKQQIDSHRIDIDTIDRQLVHLLNKRAYHAIEIGIIKKRLKLQVYDPDREEEIYDNIRALNDGPLTKDAMQRLFERIIDESRSIERESAQKNRKEKNG